MTKLFTALALAAALACPASAFSNIPAAPIFDAPVMPLPLGEMPAPGLTPLPDPFPGWITPGTSATQTEYLA